MGLNQYRYYRASCDVRLDRATKVPLVPQPDVAAWEAWSNAGRSDAGPERDAIGDTCSRQSEEIYAPSLAMARRELMAAGWKVIARGLRLPPRGACPDHREVSL